MYFLMALSVLSLISSSDSRLLFRFDPLAHCAVAGCCLFILRRETSMLHRWHRGWRRFPSSKMTTVSSTSQCRKWTHITVLVAAWPGHPSTGQLYGPPLAGKSMQYMRSSSLMDEVFQLRLASAALPCCVILCPAKDTVVTSS